MMGTHRLTKSWYGTSPLASRFISATNPVASSSSKQSPCICWSVGSMRSLKMVSGGNTGVGFRVSSTSENTWMSVRSTDSWSTSTFFSTGASSPSPGVATLAAPRAASSAFWRSFAASACSSIRRSAVAAKILALHMWGMMELHMPAKMSTLTSPFEFGSARQRRTWICKRLMQISWHLSSASLIFHSFILPNSSMPTSRNRVTRCSRRNLTLQGTTALCNASARKCSSRSVSSSIMTKPLSSSGNICINMADSCGLILSIRALRHSLT
mmetsp:Transcript_70558/g.204602  ORF Transcript_70558/g.204602 Transcript_70558/m.204602 type:complete len:269 (-) Transcript_70558:1325-2131(-)